MAYINGKRLRKKRTRMKDMNVTPMVDVMTVLLSVFMITAPLMTTGIEINLPNGGASTLNSADKAVNISVDKSGKVYLADEALSEDEFMVRIKAIQKKNSKATIVISADSGVDYGKVIGVMGIVKDLGFKEVSLKTSSNHDVKNDSNNK